MPRSRNPRLLSGTTRERQRDTIKPEEYVTMRGTGARPASPPRSPDHQLRNRLRTGVVLAALAIPLAAAALVPSEPDADGRLLHLRLEATSPAADTVITEPPEEIRLFFSEPPQMRGTAVRLADGEGELVPTTDATADEDDPSQVFIRPREPLTTGEYTVHWRTIAQDGHAQNGNFSFELRRP
jgi:copper resistance protein C